MEEMQAGAPEAAAQEAPNEDQIVDQIGALLNQLSPEKQQALMAQLNEMLTGQVPESAGTMSPNESAGSVPYQGV